MAFIQLDKDNLGDAWVKLYVLDRWPRNKFLRPGIRHKWRNEKCLNAVIILE